MNNEMKQLGARIRVDVLDALRQLSKRDRVSMASITERALKDYLWANGIEVDNG